jgi:hypothetical protein
MTVRRARIPESSSPISPEPSGHCKKKSILELRWPLGLRVLAPAAKAEALRRQVDTLVQQSATQFAGGKLSPGTVELAIDATAQLRKLLHQRNGSAAIAEQTVRDADGFLNRVDTALLALKQ